MINTNETEEAEAFLQKHEGQCVLPKDTGDLFLQVANTALWLRLWFESKGREQAEEPSPKLLSILQESGISIPSYVETKEDLIAYLLDEVKEAEKRGHETGKLEGQQYIIHEQQLLRPEIIREARLELLEEIEAEMHYHESCLSLPKGTYPNHNCITQLRWKIQEVRKAQEVRS